MKVRVIKEFIDKHTRKFNPVGVEIEVTDERLAELKEAGKFVIEIQEQTEQTDEADAAATLADAAEPEKKTRGRRK